MFDDKRRAAVQQANLSFMIYLSCVSTSIAWASQGQIRQSVNNRNEPRLKRESLDPGQNMQGRRSAGKRSSRADVEMAQENTNRPILLPHSAHEVTKLLNTGALGSSEVSRRLQSDT